MARRVFTWTNHQVDKLNKVQEVLAELEDYKPLTLRQVYYQLVGRGYIENKVSQYGMLSNLLKWARIHGHIAWEDVEDRVRAFHNARGFENKESFIKQEIKNFLYGYRRHLLQTQEKYIEVWIEKDALSSIFRRIAMPYCIPTVVCRGFSSVSFLNEFRTRLYYNRYKKPVMLYFGDFDPSGVEMLRAMKTTLEKELGVKGIEFKRVALQKEDIFKYQLPHNPDALKKTDTRARKHLEAYGELAVELDALRPDVLEGKIRKAIEAELDMDDFQRELQEQKKDLEGIEELKQKVYLSIGLDFK